MLKRGHWRGQFAVTASWALRELKRSMCLLISAPKVSLPGCNIFGKLFGASVLWLNLGPDGVVRPGLVTGSPSYDLG
jgi:hypothetical protein